MNNENLKNINHIIDEMITIKPPEGGFKPEDFYIWASNNIGKRIVAIEGDSSSGVIWYAKQKQKEIQK